MDNNSITCMEVCKKMAAFIENDLKPEISELISIHLISCPYCQRELALLKKDMAEITYFKEVHEK
jgi:hypothetical protein